MKDVDPGIQVVMKQEMIDEVEEKSQSVSGKTNEGKEGGGRTQRDLLG